MQHAQPRNRDEVDRELVLLSRRLHRAEEQFEFDKVATLTADIDDMLELRREYGQDEQ